MECISQNEIYIALISIWLYHNLEADTLRANKTISRKTDLTLENHSNVGS